MLICLKIYFYWEYKCNGFSIFDFLLIKRSFRVCEVCLQISSCKNSSDSAMILDKMEHEGDSGKELNLDDLKEALLTHICSENKAFFKSQQIDDPELSFADRKEIATEILNKSHSKFLQRFGMNMKEQHLKFFESQFYNPLEQQEVTENLKHISWNINHHGSIVRNRRYAALLKLVEEKKYFSEGEMKSRDPLLYEQLIGQYQSPGLV